MSKSQMASSTGPGQQRTAAEKAAASRAAAATAPAERRQQLQQQPVRLVLSAPLPPEQPGEPVPLFLFRPNNKPLRRRRTPCSREKRRCWLTPRHVPRPQSDVYKRGGPTLGKLPQCAPHEVATTVILERDEQSAWCGWYNTAVEDFVADVHGRGGPWTCSIWTPPGSSWTSAELSMLHMNWTCIQA